MLRGWGPVRVHTDRHRPGPAKGTKASAEQEIVCRERRLALLALVLSWILEVVVSFVWMSEIHFAASCLDFLRFGLLEARGSWPGFKVLAGKR